MTGPFDNIFGNTPFDLNRDGHIDAGEWALINETLFSDNSSSYSDDEDDYDDDDETDGFDSDGLEDELERSGLDLIDLEMMDPEERREALEDAGFDADDFDDFDF